MNEAGGHKGKASYGSSIKKYEAIKATDKSLQNAYAKLFIHYRLKTNYNYDLSLTCRLVLEICI